MVNGAIYFNFHLSLFRKLSLALQCLTANAKKLLIWLRKSIQTRSYFRQNFMMINLN